MISSTRKNLKFIKSLQICKYCVRGNCVRQGIPRLYWHQSHAVPAHSDFRFSETGGGPGVMLIRYENVPFRTLYWDRFYLNTRGNPRFWLLYNWKCVTNQFFGFEPLWRRFILLSYPAAFSAGGWHIRYECTRSADGRHPARTPRWWVWRVGDQWAVRRKVQIGALVFRTVRCTCMVDYKS